MRKFAFFENHVSIRSEHLSRTMQLQLQFQFSRGIIVVRGKRGKFVEFSRSYSFFHCVSESMIVRGTNEKFETGKPLIPANVRKGMKAQIKLRLRRIIKK